MPLVEHPDSGRTPLDNVILTEIFNQEQAVVYEFRRNGHKGGGQWVDVGRGTLKIWRKVVEGHFPMESTPQDDRTDDLHLVEEWSAYVKEDIKWVQLEQTQGVAPIWSLRLSELTRYVSYPVQGAVMIATAAGGQGKVYAVRALRKRFINGLEMYVDGYDDDNGVVEDGPDDNDDDEDLEEMESKEEMEKEKQKDKTENSNENHDSDKQDLTESIVTADVDNMNDVIPIQTSKEDECSQNSVTDTKSNDLSEFENAQSMLDFSWSLIDFLRDNTHAVGQITGGQLPMYLSLYPMRLYVHSGDEWLDKGLGTVQIYKLRRAFCLRFLQIGTYRHLLVTPLSSCIYNQIPTKKQCAVQMSCHVKTGKGIMERMNVAFKRAEEPKMSEMDLLEKANEGDITQAMEDLEISMQQRSNISQRRLAVDAAMTMLGALSRTDAKVLSK